MKDEDKIEEKEGEEIKEENEEDFGKLTEEDILKKENKKEEPKEENSEQEKSHNKILKGFFIGIISFVVMFVIVIFIVKSVNNFSYRGVEFQVDKNTMVGRTLYRTSIPVGQKDSITGKIVSNADYNFWLRNDPRRVDKKVPLANGDIYFRKNIVFYLTENETIRGQLMCEGDWVIAFQNAINLFQLLGYKTSVKNDTAKYEPIEDFTFINVQIGDSTNIEKKPATMELGKNGEVETKDQNTYDLNINNCEVLPAFEKLMLEAFVQYNRGA